MTVGFKTPIQERAEREIFSKDKEVAKKAMEILFDEADRLIDAHCAVMSYQLLLASPAMIEGEIKISKKNDRSESI